MGSIVTVLEVYELRREKKEHQKARRWWERVPLQPPRSGWVVGFRTIYDGVIHPAGYVGSYLGEPEVEPGYLSRTASHRCLLVAFTPYAKPVRVPEGGFDDFRPAEPHFDLPESARRALSEESKGWPRDANGRFA
jgi:hypothetical protein